MPLQDTYPPLAGPLPSTAYVTGFWTDSNGNLQTVKIPAQFVYGNKWTNGSGAPVTAGVYTGDMYLDVASGNVYTWNATTLSWGSPITNLISGALTVGIWSSAAPAASQVLYSLSSPWPVKFAANFAGSLATSNVAATASAVFTVTQNGTQIGVITFGAGQTTGTFATSGGAVQNLAIGDVLTVTAPSSQDATLAGIRISLIGTTGGTTSSALTIASLTVTGATFAINPATTTTAPAAGGAGALPATPTGYATITIDGTPRQIAYY